MCPPQAPLGRPPRCHCWRLLPTLVCPWRRQTACGTIELLRFMRSSSSLSTYRLHLPSSKTSSSAGTTQPPRASYMRCVRSTDGRGPTSPRTSRMTGTIHRTRGWVTLGPPGLGARTSLASTCGFQCPAQARPTTNPDLAISPKRPPLPYRD